MTDQELVTKVGRKGKYTPEMVAEIARLTSAGNLIKDICEKVDITYDTYFNWLNNKPEFSEAVTRAQGEAKIGAVLSIRKAMMPHEVKTVTTKTVSVTKLRKIKHKDGTVEEVPYTDTRTDITETSTNEFDWRAAAWWLERRFPADYGKSLMINLTPEEAQVLQALGLNKQEVWTQLIQELAQESGEPLALPENATEE